MPGSPADYMVYRDYLKDLWAHIAHEDFYLGAATAAGGYAVLQLVAFAVTGGWIGG
nr:MAG TPA: hypothetical protein [Caudoviricetes sp.]